MVSDHNESHATRAPASPSSSHDLQCNSKKHLSKPYWLLKKVNLGILLLLTKKLSITATNPTGMLIVRC